DMLELSRSNAPKVAEALGFENVEFRRGRIQDLALDLDLVESWLKTHPVHNALSLSALEDFTDQARRTHTLIPDNSVDIVVSNCVLNLVREQDKPQLIQEIHRVLKPGGRIALSDIVSDEVVPEALRADPTLWSGCISGAFQEKELLSELEEAGFLGIALDKWESEPWQTVEGIEFRSVTVTAVKGEARPCLEANQAVIYKGPWKWVEDDDGHVLRRGERVAVCDKTFDRLTGEPYGEFIIGIEPRVTVPPEQRELFDCQRSETRSPRESKGSDYAATTEAAEDCCGAAVPNPSGESCC
ncbi:MAG: methyltransferase domain-containing protein, partial [Deltaproteobacteria bacterium]|nr:methyltransferase domain-containing protein [Deltaproteobacteria bacterium]